MNSATAVSRRYSARAASRPAADIAPSTWLSVSRPRSPAACSVSAASTGPGRIASADRSRANTSPPSPSGPSIAASSARSTSAASPRPMVAAGPSTSHSSGIRARPASRSAIYDGHLRVAVPVIVPRRVAGRRLLAVWPGTGERGLGHCKLQVRIIVASIHDYTNTISNPSDNRRLESHHVQDLFRSGAGWERESPRARSE